MFVQEDDEDAELAGPYDERIDHAGRFVFGQLLSLEDANTRSRRLQAEVCSGHALWTVLGFCLVFALRQLPERSCFALLVHPVVCHVFPIVLADWWQFPDLVCISSSPLPRRTIFS